MTVRHVAAIAVVLAAGCAVCLGEPRTSDAVCLDRNDCHPGLACIHGVCRSCMVNADCTDGPSDVSKQCDASYANATGGDPLAQCKDKDVLSPFTRWDAIAAILAVGSTALGSACGLGGGGLLVPVYMVVLGLTPKFAIPLSKATIFGGAIATYWSNFRSKHPYAPHRPLIDYLLGAMMEPPTLAGTVFGVMLNAMLPSWLLLVLLVALLVFVIHRTTLRANKMYLKETAGTGPHNDAITNPGKHAAEHLPKPQSLEDGGATDTDTPDAMILTSATRSDVDDVQRMHADEANVFPFKQYVLPLIGCVVVLSAQGIVRGGHGATSTVGVQCGSAAYWLWLGPPLVVLAAVTYAMGRHLMHRTQVYESHALDKIEGDIHWTPRKAFFEFPVHCFFAGVVSALLGLGGGIVQGPIMLAHGVTPLVQSATSSYLILFTSSATTVQYVVAGQFPGVLKYDYACWYATLGFVGGVLGKTVVEHLIRKSGRMSLVLYFMIANCVLQVFVMGYLGLRVVLRGGGGGFSGLCGP